MKIENINHQWWYRIVKTCSILLSIEATLAVILSYYAGFFLHNTAEQATIVGLEVVMVFHIPTAICGPQITIIHYSYYWLDDILKYHNT